MSKTCAEETPKSGSLITSGLREASARKEPRNTVVQFQDPIDAVTWSKRVTTISVQEVPDSTGYILELGPPYSPKRPIRKRRDSEVPVWEKWGYTDPQIIRPKPVLSLASRHTTVHKGFGRFGMEKEPVMFQERIPFYPPFPNAAYNFLNKKVEPCGALAMNTSFDGAALVRAYILKKNAEEATTVSARVADLAEQAVDMIDWTQRLYTGGEKTLQGVPGFCIDFWRIDLIMAVNDAIGRGQEPLEMCNKCHKRHIIWGPSISMQDRDTCFSQLPAWFPAEKFEEPWNAFMQIINKLVMFEEIEQGRVLDPNRTVWDKSFHDASEKWMMPGRVKGGWWKCRTGIREGEVDVPMAERNCRLCHRARTKEEDAIEARSKKDVEEKIRINTWIERCMRIQMRKDRAIVEAQIRCG